jgi:hypothetical protein
MRYHKGADTQHTAAVERAWRLPESEKGISGFRGYDLFFSGATYGGGCLQSDEFVRRG